jgi:hypothetical protein
MGSRVEGFVWTFAEPSPPRFTRSPFPANAGRNSKRPERRRSGPFFTPGDNPLAGGGRPL